MKTQPQSARSEASAEKARNSARPALTVAPNPVWGGLALRVQTKLTVNTPGDAAEVEADRVAASVMRMPAPAVQRKCAACSAGGATCPSCKEEETRVQRKAVNASNAAHGAGEVDSDFASRLRGGAPLDATSRAFFEPRFGHDFGSVRVHTGPEAAAAARSLNARAFTLGRSVAFAAGEYEPQSERGRSLLAHELVHVLQQAPGAASVSKSPPRVARNTPQAEMQAIREESVRGAIQFLDSLRETVESDRRLARSTAAQAGGIAEASRRAHPILNQRGVRERLRRGREIYDAQRALLDANHPLQGELREIYAGFLSEVREAFNEALSVAANDREAQLQEQSMYGESLVLWLEASPLRAEALAGRTSFVPGDVAASHRQETDLAAVLTTIVPHLNLVQPGMTARARTAIEGTSNRVTTPAAGAPQQTTATGATKTAADAAVAQLDAAGRTIDRGRVLLRAAIARLDVWLQAPAQPVDAADRVNELFNTRDAGYGQLLRDRLQVMLTNLEGSGSLFAHMHRPGDTATCTTASTLGQMPRSYEFEFCGAFGNLDRDAGILLHELAHAVTPGRGSRGSATVGFPQDRAYSGERLLRRMTTEEALNNAESYSQLIETLAGLAVERIPTDTVTGCADTAPLLDALALAQSAHRRAWSHLDDARAQLRTGRTIEAGLRAQIDTHLGSPTDADLLVMLNDFGDIQSDAFIWYIGHTYVCAPARECPAGALAFDDRRVYKNGSVTARRRSGSRDPRICPDFLALGINDRARAAHSLVALSFGDSFLRRPQSVFGYAALALAMYRSDFGAPPAASLAEHRAADQAAGAPRP